MNRVQLRIAGSASSRAGHVVDRVLVGLFAVAILVTIASLRSESRARGFTLIDTARSRLDPPWGWVDPRWHTQLAHRLAELGPLDSERRAEVERVAARLAELSFVVEVGTPETIWPEGVRVPLRLADVVACARVGRWFQPVAADGRLLPGRWPSPPAAGAGYLPVIGPVDAAPPDLRPGDQLQGAAARSGLAIATSMWRHLDDLAVARLGRVVIDATRAAETSVEEPGARLLMEGGREILFGRGPDLDEPGELPVASKWRSLAAALEALEFAQANAGSGEGAVPTGATPAGPTGFDWGVCDLRWDQAELSPPVRADFELDETPSSSVR